MLEGGWSAMRSDSSFMASRAASFPEMTLGSAPAAAVHHRALGQVVLRTCVRAWAIPDRSRSRSANRDPFEHQTAIHAAGRNGASLHRSDGMSC